MAASQTWTGGGIDGLWSTGANWSGGAMPGAINTLPNTVSNDVATFNGPVGAVSPIIFDNLLNVASIVFDTADAGAYTFQHPNWNPDDRGLGYQGTGLWLTSTATPAGNITMNPAVVNPQVFNTPIVFRPANSRDTVYSFVNNAAASNATLSFNGSLINNSANTRPLTADSGAAATRETTRSARSTAAIRWVRAGNCCQQDRHGHVDPHRANGNWLQKTSNQTPASVRQRWNAGDSEQRRVGRLDAEQHSHPGHGHDAAGYHRSGEQWHNARWHGAIAGEWQLIDQRGCACHNRHGCEAGDGQCFPRPDRQRTCYRRRRHKRSARWRAGTIVAWGHGHIPGLLVI
jgi:hypothetical protein